MGKNTYIVTVDAKHDQADEDGEELHLDKGMRIFVPFSRTIVVERRGLRMLES